jgi:hypothetical protein
MRLSLFSVVVALMLAGCTPVPSADDRAVETATSEANEQGEATVYSYVIEIDAEVESASILIRDSETVFFHDVASMPFTFHFESPDKFPYSWTSVLGGEGFCQLFRDGVLAGEFSYDGPLWLDRLQCLFTVD